MLDESSRKALLEEELADEIKKAMEMSQFYEDRISSRVFDSDKGVVAKLRQLKEVHSQYVDILLKEWGEYAKDSTSSTGQ